MGFASEDMLQAQNDTGNADTVSVHFAAADFLFVSAPFRYIYNVSAVHSLDRVRYRADKAERVHRTAGKSRHFGKACKKDSCYRSGSFCRYKSLLGRLQLLS